MNTNVISVEKPLLNRLDMEDAIERLFAAGKVNQRQVIDLIDILTPADVSRQEVAFNVALVANEGIPLAGRAPIKSLLVATGIDSCQSDKVTPNRPVPGSFLANTVRQLAALACYFTAIYAVGLLILAREVGIAAALPLAVKTCAGKSLVAALIGPWIQRLTGVSSS